MLAPAVSVLFPRVCVPCYVVDVRHRLQHTQGERTHKWMRLNTNKDNNFKDEKKM
jgi:hypothetical protein